jgi:hypothetical protein
LFVYTSWSYESITLVEPEWDKDISKLLFGFSIEVDLNFNKVFSTVFLPSPILNTMNIIFEYGWFLIINGVNSTVSVEELIAFSKELELEIAHAIFDVGLKVSSPKLLLALMPEVESLSTGKKLCIISRLFILYLIL